MIEDLPHCKEKKCLDNNSICLLPTCKTSDATFSEVAL